jgi:pilus assembly protein Flp/PilA
MKKLIAVFVFCIGVFGIVNAQDAVAYKNEGNAALKEKKYAEALTKFEKSLAAWGKADADNPMIYNTGYCAYKTKDYNKAIKYFGQSIAASYKAETAIRYKAISNLKLKNEEEYVSTLSGGLVKYPNSKSIKKDLTKFYNKKAKEKYNEGAQILKRAAGSVGAGKYKTTDAAYIAEVAKAKKRFKAAIEHVDKSLEYIPNDATALQLKKGCEANLEL